MRSAAVILLGTLLVACNRDQDEDGYKGKNDCDDTNSEIYPGAAEECDGVDNDCDQSVDEGLLLTWYADLDLDSYGDPDNSIEACTQPSGYVENSDDCNDDSDEFYPGAPEDECSDDNDYNCDGSVGYDDNDGDGYAACEGDCDDSDENINIDAEEVCDGIDNNCDGFADRDAVDAPNWYLDHDSDTYGDAKFVLVLCDQPPNYVTNADDCDDLNSNNYPGADEVCDLEDNNCDGEIDEDTAIDVSIWYADTDGDGYGDAKLTTTSCPDELGLGPEGYVADSTDCDDSTKLVNPGATEFCDDIDNNCDKVIDLDADDTIVWYIDGDGDGYGEATKTVESCEQPSGYALNSDDCNDELDNIYPGATEICDGIDNDCDGDTDDDDPDVDTSTTGSTFYADNDGDGYGDLTNTIDACYQPSGYVEDSADCLDSDELVNPDATEVCDDGIDNNCDEEYTACELEISASSDTIAFYGNTSGEGSYALTHADLNDDDIDDIIIGAYYSSNGGTSSLDGAAYIFYGPFSSGVSTTSADLTITGRSGTKDAFGSAASDLGDFDGDGVDDVAITAPQVDNDALASGTTAGGIFIFSGADVASESAIESEEAGIILLGEGKQQYLGGSVFGDYDLNGDGVMDLIAGGSRAPDRLTQQGAVYLVYGGLSAATYTISDVAQARFEGESSGDKIGTSGTAALVGDMNGDGDGDLVIGAYLHNSESGAAYLMAGPLSGQSNVVDAATAKMVPDSTGDYAGRGVTPAGDVDNDGYDDFWVSSPREDTVASSAGAIFLIYGNMSVANYDESTKGMTLDSAAGFAVYGSTSNDQIGAIIDGTGDLDGDGNNDLLIGMPSYGAVSQGAAFFFYGPPSGISTLTAEADAIFIGSNSSDNAGSDARFVGDVDGSGTDSILIDVPEDDNNPSGVSNAGAAYLVFGFDL